VRAVDDLRLLCFGDSFVAGVGDPRGQGWVGRVVEAVHAAGRPLMAYNLGVRRETSVEVAVRLRFEAMPRLLAGADCRVVFAVGANDTTVEAGAERVPPDRSCMALDKMLDQVADLGLPAAVAGPPPAGDDAQQARVVALTDAFAEVCAAREVPFWPVAQTLLASRTWLDEAAAGGGAHPGAAGYELLARTLLDAGLLDWLLRAPAATSGGDSRA
jgi:lysophospholipase L1-like esterase